MAFRLRLVLLLLALLLIAAPISSQLITQAQDGSPVPSESIPTETPTPAPTTQDLDRKSTTEPVAPADVEGNTPIGPHTNPPVFPSARTDVYVAIAMVTVAGQTDAIDGTNGNGPFAAEGYRSDNAKILTILTTATYEGNLNICIVFDGPTFANPSEIELLFFDGAEWGVITNYLDDTTVCGYSSVFGTFAVAETGAAPTRAATDLPTSTPTESATSTAATTITSTPSAISTLIPTETETSTATATATGTSTSAPSPIQFALPNVYVQYAQIPTSGTTTGEVISSSGLPALPAAYLSSNPWFFLVESTVVQSGNKRLCVNFETNPYSDPHRLVLLQRNGSNWSSLPNQVLESLAAEQGTMCGYISSFGEFALVERAPATASPTSSPSRTPLPTSTASPTRTASAAATASPTVTPSSTATSSPTASATPSLTPSGTFTPTVTQTSTRSATLAPGSYLAGTQVRTTARVNLRTAASTSSPSKGVISSGTTVAVTGPSVTSGGLIWVPVMSSLGSGWIAGNYLKPVVTATPTRTPASPTSTQTPGGSEPTRTATRPPGGYIAGDAVRTTANVNLRSAPSTSSTVLRVIPGKTEGIVTGPGVKSGSNTFYPVSISGFTGYLASSYLQRITATATPSRTSTPTATVVGTTVRFTTDNVNMRTGPGTGYSKVATIPKGTRINITGTPRRSGGIDWYPVILNGVGSGWMAGSFLTAIPPI